MSDVPDYDYYDALEIRSPEQREGELMAALAHHVAYAKANAAAYAKSLRDVDAASINSRKALATLPVVRKADLKAMQAATRPFGGLVVQTAGAVGKIFQSPGPIYEPEGTSSNYWRSARAMYAAGFRRGDRVLNCYSYHLTPAGSMMESGALAIGCEVIPAGVGQTELQLQAIADLRPNAYLGTPSFLRILLEKADETGTDVSCIRKGLVSGEALPPSLRDWFAARGVQVLQMFGTADVGLIAYETPGADGKPNPGMVMDEDVILEVVQPGGGTPVQDGEVGELVVTTLNRVYPLIRFSIGDLTAVLNGVSPCGRTNVRIRGWLGRADQTTKVRGMFVHATQVQEVMKRHPQVHQARLVVSGEMANDQLALLCEVDDEQTGLADQIAQSVRDITKLRADVRLHAPGSLPRDGKLIEDIRSYK
jgi:phenylacetate-CoA ligase